MSVLFFSFRRAPFSPFSLGSLLLPGSPLFPDPPESRKKMELPPLLLPRLLFFLSTDFWDRPDGFPSFFRHPERTLVALLLTLDRRDSSPFL